MLFDKLKQLITQDKADTEILHYFAKNKRLLRKHDKEGFSALYHILKSTRANLALLLFEAYPFSMSIIAAKRYGATPLYVAAQQGHIKVVEALLAAGADKDKAIKTGATPLLIAATNGHIVVVSALIEAGADIDKAKANGVTPLLIAVTNGHIVVVRALIAAGADIDKAHTSGASPLYIAAQEGHIQVVKALLAAGADKEKPLANGATLLVVVAQRGHLEVLNALLAFGADIKLKFRGVTPLLLASINNHPEVVKVLASHPDTTLEMLQVYLNDPEVPEAIQQILREEVDSRLEMAMQDAACEMALSFWPPGPITHGLIVDPVRARDNNVYEESAIRQWFEGNGTSPMTGLVLQSKALTPDLTAKSCITRAREVVDAFCKQEKTKDFESWSGAIKQAIMAAHQVAKPAEGLGVVSSSPVGVFFGSTSEQVDEMAPQSEEGVRGSRRRITML